MKNNKNADTNCKNLSDVFLKAMKTIPIAIKPARIGHKTHVARIVDRVLRSVEEPVKRFQPMIGGRM